MTADALRLRKTRRAIYGPPLAALVGVALIGAGVVGLVRNSTSDSDDAPNVALAPSATVDAVREFTLVDTKGRLYPGGKNDPAAIVRPSLPRSTAVVAAAPSPTGGHWLVTKDGRVIAVGVASLGQHRVGKGASPTVGIAASPDGGYWLARSDGRVDAFGAAHRGDLARKKHAPVVGIAAAPDGGYWLAMSDGKVKGFGTPEKGDGLRIRGARIVGIAASARGGYWLATAGGRVEAFDAPAWGDASRMDLRSRVAAIAATPDGGFWLTTRVGSVYAFGPDNKGTRLQRSFGAGMIVAIVRS